MCIYSANQAALHSRRLAHMFPGYANCAHGHVLSLTGDGSRTVERIICFRGTQTVPTLRNERLTPLQRIVTRIILDISRSRHRPVVNTFYCPAPYFYLPRDLLKFEPWFYIYDLSLGFWLWLTLPKTSTITINCNPQN